MRLSPLPRLVFLVFLVVQAAACAGRPAVKPGGGATGRGDSAAHPPRPSNCRLTVVHAPTPGVAAWDDLGVAEVTCHIDIGLPQCLQRFRAEVCRMGGDIVYDLPEKPLRPREQAVLYRGRVAHGRAPAPVPAAPPAQAPADHQDNPKPYSNSGE